jgi:hypothetical protein
MRLARHQFADEDLETAERRIRESPASPAWRCLRCWFAAQSGNLDQANADLDWLAEDHFARLPRDANWLPALFEGKLATTAGNLDSGAAHYQAALELERHWGARAWLVRTRARYADVLLRRSAPGDQETALDLAREAIAQSRALRISADLLTREVRHHADAPLQPS